MAVLKKYNLSGSEVGQVTVGDALLQGSVNPQMIKDYVVAFRANQRQWSANTKTRAEVNHSGQKPHPQKGTGRARQGFLGATQYKGGGRVFGPRPKFDQHVAMNKKEKQAVIRYLISQKIQEEHLHVLSTEGLEAPKTKSFVEFLQKLGLVNKRVLFLGPQPDSLEIEVVWDNAEEMKSAPSEEEIKAATEKLEAFSAEQATLYKQKELVSRSVRNVPKVSYSLLPNINGYDLLLNQDIVLLDTAVEQLIGFFGGESHE